MTDQVFVDSSALFAVIDREGRFHDRAARYWSSTAARGLSHVTNQAVAIEASSLIANRMTFDEVRALHDDLLPPITLLQVSDSEWMRATTAYLASGNTSVSLVDRLSFAFMREHGIEQAFAFDRHFEREGFRLVA